MKSSSPFSYLMDEKKDNDNDELVEIDLKSMTDKQKKKLIDLKKEQSKIEKDKSKIEVDILKKMVDEMKEGKKEDDDETDEAGLTILSMYEEIKKKTRRNRCSSKSQPTIIQHDLWS